MAIEHFEVDIQFRETGTGQAEIVVPQVLADKKWQYVLAHEAGSKAIIQIEATSDEHTALAADPACRLLSVEQLEALKKDYPTPKMKRKYRDVEAASQATEPEEGTARAAPVLETLQTVRWKFYLIDIPIQP